MSKLVVIIQCDTVQQRCCGYNCTHAFYSREGKFAGYPEDTHYMSFTCGGCSGGALTVKLETWRSACAALKRMGRRFACIFLPAWYRIIRISRLVRILITSKRF